MLHAVVVVDILSAVKQLLLFALFLGLWALDRGAQRLLLLKRFIDSREHIDLL